MVIRCQPYLYGFNEFKTAAIAIAKAKAKAMDEDYTTTFNNLPSIQITFNKILIIYICIVNILRFSALVFRLSTFAKGSVAQ